MAARKIAEEGIVLLKNNNKILPVNIGSLNRILVVGENAVKMMSRDGGSSEAKSKYEVVPLEGIRKYVADRIEVDYQPGYSSTASKSVNDSLHTEAVKAANIALYELEKKKQKETEAAAKQAAKEQEKQRRQQVEDYEDGIAQMEAEDERWNEQQRRNGQITENDFIYSLSARAQRYRQYADEVLQIDYMTEEERSELRQKYLNLAAQAEEQVAREQRQAAELASRAQHAAEKARRHAEHAAERAQRHADHLAEKAQRHADHAAERAQRHDDRHDSRD